MKKTLALLLALLTLCTAFSGCGDKKSDGKNNDGKNDTQKTEETFRTYETPEIEALVVTAEAYLARRAYLQYDDTRLVDRDVGTIYRTDRFYYTPEDCTRQFTAYSNCAAWTYEVYYRALGIDIKYWYTEALQGATQLHVLTQNLTGKETDAEKEELKAKFFATLQAGDIINYRNADGSGHAMLYVGYDEIIHCTSAGGGGNYNYSGNSEVYEGAGGVQLMKTDRLFATNGSNMFAQKAYSIVRPLISDEYKDAKPTEEAVNRINNLRNVVVEKCSTHPAGFTAVPGEEITYTFYIRSGRAVDITLDLVDEVPTNTAYVSGAEKQEGNKLYWTVKVPSGETVEVKYTVKVNADAKTGDEIYSEGTIGGVSVRCRPTYVGKSLDAATRDKIATSAAKAATMGATGIELAKKIYADAGVTISIPDAKTILNSLYKNVSSTYVLNTESEYMAMLVPTMYGGYKCATSTGLYNGWRTKGVLASQLMAGDILVCGESGKYVTYMYTGNNKVLAMDGAKIEVLDLMKSRDALISALGYDIFAVIRPAMAQ